MAIKPLLAAASLLALGACATSPMPEISPVQTLSHAVTPETAQTLASRGQYGQAVVAYRSALKTNAEDASARYGLAEALRKSGKPDEARGEYTTLLNNPEWKARALEGLGWVSLTSAERTDAFSLFNQAVAEDAKMWGAWLGIAQTHDLDKNWAKADEAYALALASTDEPSLVLNNQGISKLARGEAGAAAELFRSALAQDPKMERARINLALADAVNGKSLQAVGASEQDARERAKLLNNYGYVAMLQGRPDEARAFYQAALKEHPSFYPRAFQNLKSLDASKADDEAPANQ